MTKYLKPALIAVSLMSLNTAQAADSKDIAAGIIGGMIMGNMIQQYIQPYMQPHMNPQPPVVIMPPPVVIQAPCYWVQEPLYDAWGRIVTYRQVRVCRTH